MLCPESLLDHMAETWLHLKDTANVACEQPFPYPLMVV